MTQAECEAHALTLEAFDLRKETGDRKAKITMTTGDEVELSVDPSLDGAGDEKRCARFSRFSRFSRFLCFFLARLIL